MLHFTNNAHVSKTHCAASFFFSFLFPPSKTCDILHFLPECYSILLRSHFTHSLTYARTFIILGRALIKYITRHKYNIQRLFVLTSAHHRISRCQIRSHTKITSCPLFRMPKPRIHLYFHISISLPILYQGMHSACKWWVDPKQKFLKDITYFSTFASLLSISIQALRCLFFSPFIALPVTTVRATFRLRHPFIMQLLFGMSTRHHKAHYLYLTIHTIILL